jgi:biotin transport system substrate-specific component
MRNTDPREPMGPAIAATPTCSVPVPGIAKVLGCCLLVALAAQVRIPVPGTDVPMTLQSTAVLLCGFALCPAEAALAMVLYVLGGASGMPLFTPGSGGVLGSTGGYIVGFLPAAWLVSLLRGSGGASFGRLFIAGAAGTGVIFVLGALWPWRVALYGGDVGMSVTTGVLPFAVKAVVQLSLAVTAVVSIRGLRRRRT